jgi:Fungal rhodopsin domain
MFLVGAWAVTFCFIIIFQCRPIEGIWDSAVPSKCLSTMGLVFSCAGIGIFQDFVILLMPLPQLVKLQMSTRKKLNILAMFSVGAFATITSIIRLGFITRIDHSLDSTWDNVEPIIWSMVEIHVTIICACMPALRALLSRWLPNLFDITHRSYNRGGSTFSLDKIATKSAATADWNHDRARMSKGQSSGDISSNNTKDKGDFSSEYELDQIRIIRKVEVNVVSASEEANDNGKHIPRSKYSTETIEFDSRGSEDRMFWGGTVKR